jgi:hypothetical protein
VIALFILGFYFSTLQEKSTTHDNSISLNDTSRESLVDNNDYAIRQKLLNDFETAFLKQYTPIVGCNALDNEVSSAKCTRHLEKSKDDFKQQFIKNRGLPKNTFEELKLSFAD